jgi:hypothetical protein
MLRSGFYMIYIAELSKFHVALLLIHTLEVEEI